MVNTTIKKKNKIVNQTIKEEFTLKNATLYGGYNLFSDYLTLNGLDRLLQEELGGMKAAWADYSMPVVCRTLIDGYALGLDNIYQFDSIEKDPLITEKRGLEKLPHQSVMRKDLINQFMTDEDVHRLRCVKTRQVKKELNKIKGMLVLEFDSTVSTGYGSQEGLEVGHNPHKPGRASYHPQLCRECTSGLSVWSRLRPGNTVSITDFVSFLDESWEVIPRRYKRKSRNGLCRVVSRQDSGYESEGALAWNEAHGVGYVTKMTNRGDILSEVICLSSSKYRKVETGVGEVEVGSLMFKRDAWSKERRVVVIRWKDAVDRAQTALIDGWGYTYAIFVTNLDWDEEDVYRFYDKRADVENHIREGKQDFSLEHIPTNCFYANAADLELKLLALNQVVLFTKNILKKTSPRHFASTVRRYWFMIPAKLIHHSGQRVLQLSSWWPHQDEWASYRRNLLCLQTE